MHLCGCTREKEGVHEEERGEEKERGKGKEEERINAPKDLLIYVKDQDDPPAEIMIWKLLMATRRRGQLAAISIDF